MSTVTIEYFGMDGYGRNVTEAKRDAGRKIEQAMRADYTPRLVSYRGYAVLVWQTPQGVCSAIIADEDGFRPNGRIHWYGTNSAESTKDAEPDALEWVARLGWHPDDGMEAPAFLTMSRQRDDFARWAEFQLRYRAARERGMSDVDCHSYAGRNPARRDLWAHEELSAVA